MEDGGWRMENRGWRIENREWRIENGEWVLRIDGRASIMTRENDQ
jgi:hypothetical protein